MGKQKGGKQKGGKQNGGINVDGKKLLNTGLTFCNNFAIFTNAIIILLCIGFIIFYFYFNNRYIDTQGIIISVKDSHNKKCFNEPPTGSRKDINSRCTLEISYNVNNENIKSTVEYTGYLEDYGVGDNIIVSYNKDDINDITIDKKILNIVMFVCLVIFLFTIIGTYLRIYHSDNSLIQFWIGMTCFNTFFGNRD